MQGNGPKYNVYRSQSQNRGMIGNVPYPYKEFSTRETWKTTVSDVP